ncbi:hypothetical protein [Streptomyces sp. NPDC048442]|uniref:hypothetical protein n=1 Tax=Streptomyces sp. NPDC048442 TaxID=3154823 RepID=UPI0034186D43
MAEALYQQDGKEPEAATHALEAAHWYDAAGEGAGAGAYARLILAQAYGASDRAAEGAEILESALPDLLAHGDEQAVRARDTLGRLLRELGEEKAAAEQYLLAAEIADGWDHPAPKARLAMLAGECLAGQEGLEVQAEQAYLRAAELWQQAGETFGYVRALRARTWSQLSQLLYSEDGQGDEVVELSVRASEALREFGPDELGERASCVLRVAWTEQGRGRKDEGRAALAAFVEELRPMAQESETAADMLEGLEKRLKHFG